MNNNLILKTKQFIKFIKNRDDDNAYRIIQPLDDESKRKLLLKFVKESEYEDIEFAYSELHSYHFILEHLNIL